MITTKQTELQIIDNFNDLMKDTKEKQRVNKLIKQYSFDFFMEKISDSQLEGNESPLDVFEELSTYYQKYAYIIAKRIIPQIIDKYCMDEDYYDGKTFDENGAQIIKRRRVLDTRKASEDFEGNIKEEIINLVVEDYFKNLNRVLDVYNFNNKIDNLKEKNNKRIVRNNIESIENIINYNIKGLYLHYKQEGYNNYSIVESFKNNRDVISYLYKKVLCSIKQELNIDLNKGDIESIFNKEMRIFIKTIDVKEDIEQQTHEEKNIPTAWKFYAVTEFINRLFK